jgi:hypothetical protein
MRNFILTLLILFSITASSQTKPLVGKWLTVDGGDSIILELTQEGIFYLTASDEEDTIGGIHKYSDDFGTGEDSIFLDHKYVVDMSTYPHKLTLTAYYSGTDSFCYIIPAIFEIKENNTINMVFYDDGIYNEDGDDKDALLKEFYKEAKIDDNYFEVIIFEFLK